MFKRKTDAAPAPTHSANDAVQQARTRARQRLIGAAVLLVIGIIGFPLVFESQPRPIPIDIAIDIPRRDGGAPLVMPAERVVAGPSSPVVGPVEATKDAPPLRPEAGMTARGAATKPGATKPDDEIITETRADAGRDVATTSASATAPAIGAATPVAKPASVATSTAVVTADVKRGADMAAPTPSKPVNTTATTTPMPAPASDKGASAESARARALLEGKPVATVDAPRYVVQVGAFAEAEAAREVRLKVEKLGMKTYTQIAQTPSGSRIRVRVGPFARRDEADRALAKARAAGIAANVLTL